MAVTVLKRCYFKDSDKKKNFVDLTQRKPEVGVFAYLAPVKSLSSLIKTTFLPDKDYVEMYVNLLSNINKEKGVKLLEKISSMSEITFGGYTKDYEYDGKGNIVNIPIDFTHILIERLTSRYPNKFKDGRPEDMRTNFLSLLDKDPYGVANKLVAFSKGTEVDYEKILERNLDK